MSNTVLVIRNETPCLPIFLVKSCSNLKSNDSFGFYSLRGFWNTPSKLNLMKFKLSYLRSNTNPPLKIKDILFNILINSLSKLELEINNSVINLLMSRFQNQTNNQPSPPSPSIARMTLRLAHKWINPKVPATVTGSQSPKSQGRKLQRFQAFEPFYSSLNLNLSSTVNQLLLIFK